MKPVREFAAERVAVQHCAELLRSGQAPFDMGTACAEFTAELALALPARLETLLLGPRIVVTDWPAETKAANALASSWSAPSVHFAVSFGPAFPRFVLSFDNALALALTDRLFGGRGTPDSDIPKVLPQSAALAVERLVRAMAETVASLCGAKDIDPAIVRHAVIHRLGVFKRNARCLCWSLTVEQHGSDPWNVSLAVEEPAMRAVLEQRAAGEPSRSAAREPDPAAIAFAGIPLTLTAVLAELRLPLSRLVDLQPGMTIPFAPRRDVPLSIGEQTFATGTVGALDERVALRLTRLS